VSAEDAVDLALAAEDGGASYVVMHGRTREQLYSGRADWGVIGRVRESLSIPVVANGDIRTLDDLERCAKLSGCGRFMIGRGALARPELFRVLSGLEDGWWSASQRLEWLCSYGEFCRERGVTERGVVGRVKGILRYMSEADEDIASVFLKERCCDEWDDLRAGLMKYTCR